MAIRHSPLFALSILAIFSISTPCPLADGPAEPATGATFCCFYSPSSGDKCGTCKEKAKKTNWCSNSSSNCKQCDGTWCTSGSSQTPASDSVPVSEPTPVAPAPTPSTPKKADSPAPVESHVPVPKKPAPEHSPASTNENSAAPAKEHTAPSAQVNADDREPPIKTPGGNPFVGKKLYVNPTFKKNIEKTIRTAAVGVERDNLIAMSTVASAYWLDTKKKVQPDDDDTTETAAGILKDAASMETPPLVTMIVYDLPNRDCKAKASNGEICCGGKKPEGNCDYLDAAMTGTCTDGLAEYKHEYIDKLAIVVKKYCRKVPMVLIIEPDSLPNLVTNLDYKQCGTMATTTAYRTSIKYAVQTLYAACPSATQYVDGAHGGWLGSENNQKKFVMEIKGMGISKYIRGFSLNVANCQPLGIKCPAVDFCIAGKNKGHECCDDPCGLSEQYNPGHSELNYAAALGKTFSEGIPGFSPKFIIDTARIAKSSRSSCSIWCNACGAGTGLRPTTKTDAPGIVDAYHWLETPAEFDGCMKMLRGSGMCPQFDADRDSADSIRSKPGEPRYPEAGGWFDFQFNFSLLPPTLSISLRGKPTAQSCLNPVLLLDILSVVTRVLKIIIMGKAIIAWF